MREGRFWGRGRFSERSASPPDPLSRRAAGVWVETFLLTWFRLRVGVSLIDLVESTAADRAAANFAAKEAFLKAAGTGLGGFAMPELAVLRQKSGAPYFALTGAAAAWVREQGLTVHVSLTHERGLANALVLLEKE